MGITHLGCPVVSAAVKLAAVSLGPVGCGVGHTGIGPVPVHLADVQNLEFEGCNQALCCVPQDIPDARCLAVAKAPVIGEFHCNV